MLPNQVHLFICCFFFCTHLLFLSFLTQTSHLFFCSQSVFLVLLVPLGSGHLRSTHTHARTRAHMRTYTSIYTMGFTLALAAFVCHHLNAQSHQIHTDPHTHTHTHWDAGALCSPSTERPGVCEGKIKAGLSSTAANVSGVKRKAILIARPREWVQNIVYNNVW